MNGPPKSCVCEVRGPAGGCEICRTDPPYDRYKAAVDEARTVELFEDGVEADLQEQGITTLTAAYMAGRQALLAEIDERATTPGPT